MVYIPDCTDGKLEGIKVGSPEQGAGFTCTGCGCAAITFKSGKRYVRGYDDGKWVCGSVAVELFRMLANCTDMLGECLETLEAVGVKPGEHKEGTRK